MKRESVKKTSSEVQGFSVVLVLGDLDGTAASADNVPVAARKALADMKDFLPYKSYRLLDTVWILSGGTTNTTSRLRGPDVSAPGSPGPGISREYELVLSAGPEPAGSPANGRLRVSLQLRDPSASVQLFTRVPEVSVVREPSSTPSIDHLRRELERKADDARRADSEARAAAMRDEIAKLRERLNERHPQIVERQAELDRLLREGVVARSRGVAVVPRTVIDTGFGMNIGETVVVGTSRVQGDKAIIVLLTAVPRGGRG